MVITYCERCGYLMRADDRAGSPDVCVECRAGRREAATRSRDSAQIPYAQRPSTGAIRRELAEHVRLK